jgi:hypothetical protein
MDCLLLSPPALPSRPTLPGPTNVTADTDCDLVKLEVLRCCRQAPRPQVVVVAAPTAPAGRSTGASLLRHAKDMTSHPPIISHYVKTSNRSHNICNGPLTPVHRPTSVTVVLWRPLPISVSGRPRGWPPQRSLPMWTFGNRLLKRRLHIFFVTDVK